MRRSQQGNPLSVSHSGLCIPEHSGIQSDKRNSGVSHPPQQAFCQSRHGQDAGVGTPTLGCVRTHRVGRLAWP